MRIFEERTYMNLKTVYFDLLSAIGFHQNDIEKHWIILEKAYSQKNRYYHNLMHLENMMLSFNKYQSEIQMKNEVRYAIFYHDIVYNAKKTDNELKSAEFALNILPKEVTINRTLVFDMIVATKQHQQNENKDTNWLIDFDLEILAKDWDNYKAYYEQIRKEYKIYPDFLYKPGRKKALQHFLESTNLFQTETYRTLYETKARENIRKEIAQL
jgi:predicted metal-dependent HD superfamily phosphohydrolase